MGPDTDPKNGEPGSKASCLRSGASRAYHKHTIKNSKEVTGHTVFHAGLNSRCSNDYPPAIHKPCIPSATYENLIAIIDG